MARRQQHEAEQLNAFNRWITGTLNPMQSLLGMGQTASMGTPPIGTPPQQAKTGGYQVYAGEAAAGGVGGQAAAMNNMFGNLSNLGLAAGGYFAQPNLGYMGNQSSPYGPYATQFSNTGYFDMYPQYAPGQGGQYDYLWNTPYA